MITNAPGPPTIQPGIPALQPSIPTSGVASLDIPPIQQTSSWRSSYSSLPPTKDSQQFDPVLTSPSSSASTLPNAEPVSASVSRSVSTTNSIPYLSELMSQLFSRSSTTPGSSLYASTSTPSSGAFEPKSTGLSSTSAATSRYDIKSPIEGNPETPIPPASTPSMLIYSLTLPPYSNGFDTSGIVETLTRSSPAEDKDKPSTTVYAYSLPPYTPKVPTYVATSAGTAAVDMTSGAPGGPGGAAPTDRNFLPKGFVDPTKDPVSVTSPVVPVYSPACLGNAYGGGYVITPTLSVTNPNATGIAKIPPAYGFSYKFEPTVSPGYGGAVIVVDTKAPAPAGTPQPIAGQFSNTVASPSSRDTQLVGANSGIHMPSKDVLSWASKDLAPATTGSMYGIASQGNLSPLAETRANQPSGALIGSHLPVTDESMSSYGSPLSSKGPSPADTKAHLPTPGRSIYGTSGQDNFVSSKMSGSVEPYGTSAAIPSFDKDRPSDNSASPTPTTATDVLGTTLSGNEAFSTLPASAKSSGASSGALTPPQDIEAINDKTDIPTRASTSRNTIIGGDQILSSELHGSAQMSETATGLHYPYKDVSMFGSNNPLLTSIGRYSDANVLVSSLYISGNGANSHSSVLATRVKSVIVTTSTTWCPSTAPDHLSILSSILGDVPLSTGITGNGNLANGDMFDKDAYAKDAGMTSSTALAAVTISGSTSTESELAVAPMLPNDNLHRVAVAFDSPVTDGPGTVSAQHSNSRINTTLILPGNESGMPSFEGASVKLTSNMFLVFAIISLIYLL